MNITLQSSTVKININEQSITINTPPKQTISINIGVDPSNYYDKNTIDSLLEQKQNVLISGTNIKTINNQSILGSGDLEIKAGSNIRKIKSTEFVDYENAPLIITETKPYNFVNRYFEFLNRLKSNIIRINGVDYGVTYDNKIIKNPLSENYEIIDTYIDIGWLNDIYKINNNIITFNRVGYYPLFCVYNTSLNKTFCFASNLPISTETIPIIDDNIILLNYGQYLLFSEISQYFVEPKIILNREFDFENNLTILTLNNTEGLNINDIIININRAEIVEIINIINNTIILNGIREWWANEYIVKFHQNLPETLVHNWQYPEFVEADAEGLSIVNGYCVLDNYTLNPKVCKFLGWDYQSMNPIFERVNVNVSLGRASFYGRTQYNEGNRIHFVDRDGKWYIWYPNSNQVIQREIPHYFNPMFINAILNFNNTLIMRNSINEFLCFDENTNEFIIVEE